MLGLLAALALSPAHAQDFITDVGEPQTWEQGGVWSRPMPTDDGWKLFLATQNDFWVADLEEGDGFGEWELDRDSKVNLTNIGSIQDNSIAECPDGSFLIGSSASVNDPNDSSYWTWVSADFEVLNSGAVEETSNERPHNDLTVVCNNAATGVFHSEFGMGDDFTSTLFQIDPNTGVTGTLTFEGVKTEGGAVAYDSRDGTLVAAHVSLFFEGAMSTYEGDGTLLDETKVTFLEGDWKETWSQGLIRVGEYWVVATLGRDEEQYGMGEFGDVFLIVMDSEFDVLQRTRLTTFLDDGTNANRPWIARDGDQALVGFDRENRHGVVELDLNLAEFGVDEGDDDGGGDDGWTGGGSGDDGGADGSGDDGEDGGDDEDEGNDTKDGCGCAVGSPASLGLVSLVGLLGLGRRRRD